MAADQSMSILVVADYQTTVGIVTNLLRQIGFTSVDTATSMQAALCKMRSKSYGLVIADSSLERMAQADFLADMRAAAQGERMPILILAPQSHAARVGAATLLRGEGYLFMPFNAATLQSKIDAALAAHHAFASGGLTTQADALLPSA